MNVVWTTEKVLERLQKVAERDTAVPAVANEEDAVTTAARADLPAYREAAAVLSRFDPNILHPHKPASTASSTAPTVRRKALELLLQDCILVQTSVRPPEDSGSIAAQEPRHASAVPPQPRFALRDSVRREVLRRLGTTRAALQSARNTNPDQPAGDRSNDLLQQMLDACIQTSLPPIETQTLDELYATLQVIDWLGDLPWAELPDHTAVRARIEREALLRPFRHLVGDHFRGRQAELALLREYVGVLPPGSPIEALRRHLRSLRQRLFESAAPPPLIIYGPGGIGKSTLIAKFILEHTEGSTLRDEDHFPFVYLDFDRPNLLAEEPATLLIEAVRQLGTQYAELTEPGEALRTRWEQQLFSGMASTDPQAKFTSPTLGPTAQTFPAPNQPTPGSDAESRPLSTTGFFTNRDQFLADLKGLLSGTAAQERPFLIVLDTFEVVQSRSRDHVAALVGFLKDLSAVIPLLRVVLSGRVRVEVEGIPTRHVELADLDMEAAQGYLVAHGITDPELARTIAEQVGRSPLSLRLAAEVVRREGASLSGGIRDLNTRRLFLFHLKENLIQGQLYRRILQHIADPDVRNLAHPGLVLRRITPELIRDVLAEPCGVSVPTLERARELFTALSNEVSLVTFSEDGALIHRPEVRRVMLDLLRRDEPDRVRWIHERAVAFFANQDDALARAQEIYHRLALGEDPATVQARWREDVIVYLRDADMVHELPPHAQAYLGPRVGVDIDPALQSLADLSDWEHAVERRARDLLSLNDPEKALALLHEREQRTPASRLYVLEGQTLHRLHRLREARQVVGDGIASASFAGDEIVLLDLLELAADLDERLGDDAGALRLLAEADRLAQRLSQAGREEPHRSDTTAIRQLEIGVRRLRIARHATPPQDTPSLPALKASVYAAYRAMGGDGNGAMMPERLVSFPVLYRGLAGELSLEYPDVIRAALRFVGLPALAEATSPTPRLPEVQLEALARAHTLWDIVIAQQRRHQPGAMAEGAGATFDGSLEQRWLRLIQELPPALLSERVSRLAVRYPLIAPVLAVLAAIFRGETTPPLLWADYHQSIRERQPGSAARVFEAGGGGGLASAEPTRETDAADAASEDLAMQPSSEPAPLRIGGEIPWVRRQIADLADAYNRIRAVLPPGPDRTAIMETLCMNMELLAPVSCLLLPSLIVSTSPGERLAAVVTMEAWPEAAYVAWLGQRLDTEPPFVGYHATLALRAAASTLAWNALGAVLDAIMDAQRRLGTGRDTIDRAQMLQEAEVIVKRRMSGATQMVQIGEVRFPKENSQAHVFYDGKHKGPREIYVPVTFDHPFTRQPTVIVSLHKLDLGDVAANIHRIAVRAENVDLQGFDLYFETWEDSQIYDAGASWIAVGE